MIASTRPGDQWKYVSKSRLGVILYQLGSQPSKFTSTYHSSEEFASAYAHSCEGINPWAHNKLIHQGFRPEKAAGRYIAAVVAAGGAAALGVLAVTAATPALPLAGAIAGAALAKSFFARGRDFATNPQATLEEYPVTERAFQSDPPEEHGLTHVALVDGQYVAHVKMCAYTWDPSELPPLTDCPGYSPAQACTKASAPYPTDIPREAI